MLTKSDPSHPATPPLNPAEFVKWTWQLTKDVINEYRRDGVGDLAASITFWTLLSIPAAILALVSALSSSENIIGTKAAADFQNEIETFIAETFADSEPLNDAVQELFEGSNGSVVTVASLVAFFSLSRGFAGVIRALDRAYEVEDSRAWWHVRLVAIGLAISTVFVAVGSSVTLALLPVLPGGTALRILAAPAAFVLIVLWAATLFHVGPNHRTPWRYDIPGAIVTAVGWVLATQGFALYVRFAGSGNQVQTTVGAVLLGLTLMYLLSIVMLVGAELNDVLSNRAGVVQQPVRLRERYEKVVDLLQEVRSDDEPETDDAATSHSNEPDSS